MQCICSGRDYFRLALGLHEVNVCYQLMCYVEVRSYTVKQSHPKVYQFMHSDSAL